MLQEDWQQDDELLKRDQENVLFVVILGEQVFVNNNLEN